MKTLKEVRDKLELSKLDGQTELLSNDLDLTDLAFITKKLPNMAFDEAITDGSITRTIEGASTVSITVNDHYDFIKNSGRLAKAVDIKIDGLWFRLVKVEKTGVNITLTFESREVAILRTYDKFRLSKWGQLTRARFVQILVNEVKEFHIPFVCPELKRTKFDENKSKANKAKERSGGFGDWESAKTRAQTQNKPITIKGSQPTTEQLHNAQIILDVGTNMVVRRKLMVCAMMTAITETQIRNLTYGFGFFQTKPTDPLNVRASQAVGVFQQMPNWGSYDERTNIRKAARKFFEAAQRVDAAHPTMEYGVLCQTVQVSAYPDAYALYRVEGERLVTGYGVAGGDTSNNTDLANSNNMSPWQKELKQEGQFTRGRPKKGPGGKLTFEKEDSWTCMQRLAEEVQWRSFEVSGAVYFISEPYLFKSAPRATISEETDGVDWIDYDLDIGKKNSTITITAYLDRWEAPPGCVIAIKDSGVINGKWLLTEIRRTFFSPLATITLKKPRAQLPEPKRNQIGGLVDGSLKSAQQTADTPGYEPSPPGHYPHGKALRDAVINNPLITYIRPSQTQDISMGLIKPNLLRFMLAFTDAGFPITVTALKSDHNRLTAGGNVSLHFYGRAVDNGHFTKDNMGATRQAMTWINNHKVELKIDELIGPAEDLVYPLGNYDRATLNGHKDHIHVGVLE